MESNATLYRLLYRGALSLPDSHLLLDGLTFAAILHPGTPSPALLQNPLALALESMRGRPSLRLIGVTNLQDIWSDDSGGVCLDIHPNATLTQIYFDNMFCLTQSKDTGLKVALGDSDGPDTTEIIIYPLASQSTLLQLRVARISRTPPQQQPHVPTPPRRPRPDDPAPRVMPFGFGRAPVKRVGGTSSSDSRIRPKTMTPKVDGIANLGSTVRLGSEQQEFAFKVPAVPLRSRGQAGVKDVAKRKGKEKEKQHVQEDVSGPSTVMDVDVEDKGKRKQDQVGMETETVLERNNKNFIKKSALHHLIAGIDTIPLALPIDISRHNSQISAPPSALASSHIPVLASSDVLIPTSRTTTITRIPGMPKTHPDFKELFGWVYRGVGFALRSEIKLHPLDPTAVDILVRAHISMYAPQLVHITSH